MVLNETRKILNVLKCEYPQSFQNMAKEEMQVKLNTWQQVLAPYPYELIEKAVLEYITTSNSRFAPQVSEIVNAVRKAIEPNAELLADKAWSNLRAFMRSMSKDRNIDFAKFSNLDEITREIYSYDQIRQMSESDSKDIDFRWTWFLKRYTEILTRKNDHLLTDGKIQEMIGYSTYQLTNK